MKGFFFVFVFFAQVSQADTRIVGGTDVPADHVIASSTVALIMNGGFGCSATLIAEDLAITASHCIPPANVKMAVSFGPVAKKNKVTRDIIARQRHQDYDENAEVGARDIAMVRFSGGLPAGFKPALLPTAATNLIPAEIIAAGYGTNKPPFSGSGILRMAYVDVKETDHSNKEIHLDQSKNDGACFGDSGGPLYLPDIDQPLTVIGVTSRGPGNCDIIGIFEMVQEHLPWIEATAAELRKK